MDLRSFNYHTLITCLIVVLMVTQSFSQTGTASDPYTNIHQAAAVSTAGIYHFNLDNNIFSTYVDADGYVQVAIDFGNGTGNLPQNTALTNTDRGILNPTVLLSLDGIQEVRLSSSVGNFDVMTSNATIISRVQNNTTLHQGNIDNAINDDWTGTGANYLTTNATCRTGYEIQLHKNIGHTCGIGKFRWLPVDDIQSSSTVDLGELADTESLHLWVKGLEGCSNPITSLNEAADITTAGNYCFNINGTDVFKTYVNSDGYVQVAIDFGNGTGNLPQINVLTNTTRGILNPTILSSLQGIKEVRLSSSVGNFDVMTSNATIISRVQNNTTLHQGNIDNAINNDWTGTGANYLTTNATCRTGYEIQLHKNIGHTCGIGKFRWLPVDNIQSSSTVDLGELADAESLHLWVKGLGGCSNPITSLHEAAEITTAGNYCFNINGTGVFKTYVNSDGYVQVAIDFGNGVGNLPQNTVLTNSTRGILNPTVLSSLKGIQEVRLSSSVGNFDVTTSNATIIARLQSNTTLHQGNIDNAISNDWTGTDADYLTTDATCRTGYEIQLHKNIGHTCGIGKFRWIPNGNFQSPSANDIGEVVDTESLQLWVKGLEECSNPLTSLADAEATSSAGIYCFNFNENYFKTYVDENGHVQVAIDFGNGIGVLPQTISLTNSSRGILTPSSLAAISGIAQVRITSSAGDFDVSTTNATLISRVQNNTTLHEGNIDNAINDSWIGTGSDYMTTNATCRTNYDNKLHINIGHNCGVEKFRWIPDGSSQSPSSVDLGEIGDSEYLQLWVSSSNVPLPIELLEFKAFPTKESTIELIWKSASEINNDYFYIEKSLDGIKYEIISDHIPGNGTSNFISKYNYIDRYPCVNGCYYRLTQVDYDGTSESFAPIWVNGKSAMQDMEVTLLPSVITGDHHLKVRINSKSENTISIHVYNTLGVMVYEHDIEGHMSDSRREKDYALYLPESLSKGVYHMIIKQDVHSDIEKIVIY